MDSASRALRGLTALERRARHPPIRSLPSSHPAVSWAVHHGTLRADGRRHRRDDPLRRSLARHLERGFRPDIEGLRAVAVIVVVAYHARFLGLHGGFVGVDVFFVVSGFLITRLILGELATTGRLSLAAFWARRARRLLAASAFVVVTTVIAARVVLPPLTQRAVVTDVVAAATFSSNVVFAGRLGSYFGAQLGQATPSPLLHYWSLAVEEQFYLCWPPLLAVLARRPHQYRRLVLSAIAAIGVGGFLLAAWLTPRAPSWAFFLLPTRMGELLAGALLAVVGTQVRIVPPAVRAALAWAGLVVIVVACWRLDGATPWPGTAVVVPVLATMAVIVGGTAMRLPWAPTRVLGGRGLQWVGRHSYALYLWHWPVLVLAEARGGPLGWPARLVAIGVAVGLSVLSLRLLEDPVRHNRWLAAAPVRGLGFGAAMVLVMVTAGWALARAIPALDGGTVAATPVLSATPVTPAPLADPTPTPTVTTPATATTPPALVIAPAPPTGDLPSVVAALQQTLAAASMPAPVPSNLRPSIAHARDRALPYTQGCVNVGVDARLQVCEFGVPGAARTIVLYGDSHAAQWFEPLQLIAVQRGYRLVLLAKGGCPVTDVVVATPVLRQTCPPYRDAAIAWIDANDPAIVIVSNSYTQYAHDAATWAAGAEATMSRLAAVAPHLVVIGDNPASDTDPPACLSAHVGDASACATARADAVRPDRIAGELAAARAHGATFVDTTDWFCTPTTCPVVIGDLLVLRDRTHLTPPMAEFLAPALDAALAPVFAALG